MRRLFSAITIVAMSATTVLAQSHAEGSGTTASGASSHAEGSDTPPVGGTSHAEGSSTTASGERSQGGGTDTTAITEDEHRRSFQELRRRIDGGDRLSREQKERLHKATNIAESETAIAREATRQILALTGGDADPARRAEIEAEVKAQLARIGASHQTLGALRRELEAEIYGSKDLSETQKANIKATLRKLDERRITREEAEESVNQLLGDSDSSDTFVLVLFILIVIIVCGPTC